MWGFHDRLLTLRKALYNFLTNSECQAALWRRWRWQQTQLNSQAGLVYSECEWQKEWDSIVNMASTAPRKGTTTRRRSMAFDSSFGRRYVSKNEIRLQVFYSRSTFAVMNVLRMQYTRV
jgi:OTU domain-containing protein 7